MIPPLGLVLHGPDSFDCMGPAFHLGIFLQTLPG